MSALAELELERELEPDAVSAPETIVRLAMWNVLAQTYVDPARYAYVEPDVLDSDRRRDAVIAEVHALLNFADLVVIQEAEPWLAESYANYQHAKVLYAPHPDRSDGLLLLSTVPVTAQVVSLGSRAAILADLDLYGHRVRLVAAHLSRRTTLGDAKALVPHLGPGEVILAGDLTSPWDSSAIAPLRTAGLITSAPLVSAYIDERWGATDVIAARGGVVTASAGLADEPIPNLAWPSDHLIVQAAVRFPDA